MYVGLIVIEQVFGKVTPRVARGAMSGHLTRLSLTGGGDVVSVAIARERTKLLRTAQGGEATARGIQRPYNLVARPGFHALQPVDTGRELKHRPGRVGV